MNRYSLAILGLIILLIQVEYGNAQEHPVKFDLVAGSNGIFLGKINSITRDKHDVLWLSDQTNRCVTRYDGTQMTRYQMDSKNPGNSLGGTYPETIAADSTGIIWIGFYGMGVDRFDQESNSFTHFRHIANDAGSLANDTISALLVDHLGNVWIGTNAGLDRLDPKTGTFKHFSHNVNDPSSLSYNIVRALYEDREGVLWVGTGFVFDLISPEGGLNRFDRKTETFTSYLHNPRDQHSLISNKVRAIFEDSKGNFWVGTDGDGLHTMDRRTGSFERHPYNPAKPDQLSRPFSKGGYDHITFITEDIERNIWIGTFLNGLNRYNPETKKTTHFGGDGDKSTGLKDRLCWAVNTSEDGLLWISTQEDNLYRVNLFTNIFPVDTIQGDGVNTFYEESGSVMWIGTNNGLVRRDFKNGLSKIFTNDIQNSNSLSNNLVNYILKGKDGNFWIGTGSGLNRYNPSSENFTRFLQDPNNPESISGESIVSLFEDSESNLWIGTNNGLNLMNKRAGKFSHFKKDPADSSSISDNFVLCFLEDHANDLWIGTGNGMNRMNPKTGKFRHYLRGTSVTAIYRDSDSIIWAGTTNGLYQYDRTSDNFLNKSENNSALNINNVVSMIGDDQNNLWIGAFSGIFRINNRRDMVIYYGKENGIGSQVLYFGSAYKGKDGKLFFGGNDGYYSFYPDKLKISRNLPKVQFSRLWINGQAVQATSDGPLKKPLNNTGEIHLNYDQNVVSLSFSAVDYSNTNNQILYKLENYDEDWRKPGAEGRAYYFNLPAGKYKFRIKAANSTNGIWQEKELGIVISPPWWSTWWAYCMYGLLFTGLLYAIHRVQKARLIKAEREKARVRELAQAKEIEKAYNELRMTQNQLIQAEKMASLGELTAGIAHEIQNPLNFVNNFSEVNKELIDELHEEELKQDRNPDVIANLLTNLNQNLEKISFHGKRADSIVKGMLQHSRTGSGIKEPTNINALADEYLRLSYHGLRAKVNSFNATMKTDFDESIGQVSIIPQDMGRVFLNLFNNAFYASQLRGEAEQSDPAHQHLPTIWVSTRKEGNKVFISVRDNGPGIPKKILDKIFQPFFTTKPTGQGTGLGLSLSYDIIKAHGGEIKVETREGEGSTFIIQIPF